MKLRTWMQEHAGEHATHITLARAAVQARVTAASGRVYRIAREVMGHAALPPGQPTGHRQPTMTAADLRKRKDVKGLIRDHLVKLAAGKALHEVAPVEQNRLRQDLAINNNDFAPAVRDAKMQAYRTACDGTYYWAVPAVIEYIETPPDEDEQI